MSNRLSFLATLFPYVVLVGTGCMSWWWWDSVEIDRPSRLLAELRDREQDHADDCAGWTSRSDAGDEPDRYVDDVYLLTGDMLEACNDLVGAGRIDRDDYDRVDEMRGRVRVSVDDHRTRLDVADIEAMHGACSEHHLDMVDLLDETELRLRDGGMMGSSGGMMNGQQAVP
jgi:hypothetical protein